MTCNLFSCTITECKFNKLWSCHSDGIIMTNNINCEVYKKSKEYENGRT